MSEDENEFEVYPVVLDVSATKDGGWHLVFMAEDGTQVCIHFPPDFDEDSMNVAQALLSASAQATITEALASMAVDKANELAAEMERRIQSMWN